MLSEDLSKRRNAEEHICSLRKISKHVNWGLNSEHMVLPRLFTMNRTYWIQAVSGH